MWRNRHGTSCDILYFLFRSDNRITTQGILWYRHSPVNYQTEDRYLITSWMLSISRANIVNTESTAFVVVAETPLQAWYGYRPVLSRKTTSYLPWVYVRHEIMHNHVCGSAKCTSHLTSSSLENCCLDTEYSRDTGSSTQSTKLLLRRKAYACMPKQEA